MNVEDMPDRLRSSRFTTIASLIVDAVHVMSPARSLRHVAPDLRSRSTMPTVPGLVSA